MVSHTDGILFLESGYRHLPRRLGRSQSPFSAQRASGAVATTKAGCPTNRDRTPPSAVLEEDGGFELLALTVPRMPPELDQALEVFRARREMLTWRVGDAESEETWGGVFVELASAAREGAKGGFQSAREAAQRLGEAISGMSWPWCWSHFMRNALAGIWWPRTI